MMRHIWRIALVLVLISAAAPRSLAEGEEVSKKTGNPEVSAESQADAGQVDIRSQVRLSQRQLWRAGIGAPAEAPARQVPLQEVIRGILAEPGQPRRKVSGKAAGAQLEVSKTKATPTTQPAQQQAAPTTQATTKPAEVEVQPARPTVEASAKKISPITLGRLRRLSPKCVSRPIALADSLFLGGYFQESAELYKVAMQREPSDQDHAWMLFQMANCTRESDLDTALGLYRRLLAEHPDCLWSVMAQVQSESIVWRQNNRPDELVAQLNEELAAANEKPHAEQPVSQE